MERINLAWFTEFGNLLRPLATDFFSVAEPAGRSQLATIRSYLSQLLDPSLAGSPLPSMLRSSRPAIQELADLVALVLDSQDQAEYARQHVTIFLKAAELKPLLDAELNILPTYFVFPKRAYNIDTFIVDGTKVFSDSCIAEFTDEEKYDIREGTKCLAFEVPTAAAFHLIRATESVIRRYYGEVIGSLPRQKSRNWGVYITNLRKANADPKIVFALEEMKEMYRNPIIHPETKIEMDEALSLVGITETVIGAMIRELTRLAAAKAAAAAAPTLPFVVGGPDP